MSDEFRSDADVFIRGGSWFGSPLFSVLRRPRTGRTTFRTARLGARFMRRVS